MIWLDWSVWISQGMISHAWSLAFTHTEIKGWSHWFISLLKSSVVVLYHVLLDYSPILFIDHCSLCVLLGRWISWNLVALNETHYLLLFWISCWICLIRLRIQSFKFLLLELPLIVFICQFILRMNLRFKRTLLIQQYFL